MSIYDSLSALNITMDDMLEIEQSDGFLQGFKDGVAAVAHSIIPDNWKQLLLEVAIVIGVIALAISPAGWVLEVIAAAGLIIAGVAGLADMGYQMLVNDESFGYALGHALGVAAGTFAIGEMGGAVGEVVGSIGRGSEATEVVAGGLEGFSSYYEYKGVRVPEVMAENGIAKIPPGKKVNIGGKTYIQNNSLFDINRLDEAGRTNLERMKKGIAPQNNNGESINLHHELQQNNGRRVEVSYEEHTGKHKELHPNTNSEIDRKSFNKERYNYWKERAREIEENFIKLGE